MTARSAASISRWASEIDWQPTWAVGPSLRWICQYGYRESLSSSIVKDFFVMSRCTEDGENVPGGAISPCLDE
jgi:hypothetical protein